MTLKPGTRIGAYEILAFIGAGGMGEVYRARDSRLQRDVALKLLPSSVASDRQSVTRFTREAQVLAALNHPHIASIYGVEEGDRGVALVLELVEGPTLADRIASGSLPVDEAIVVARQIADALEAAHEQGIIHRDLKPANIKLDQLGRVKVLDFGLAKTLLSAAASEFTSATSSPTLTAHATATGVILGTAAYMAPEQARGRAVDRRVDIWAFGIVLFEMLTARRPFGGGSVSETIAAVIKDAPDWTPLSAGIPVSLQLLIRRCLEKDPRRRLRDIGDARVTLEDLEAGVDSSATATSVGQRGRVAGWRAAVPWLLVALATIVAVALAVRPWNRSETDPPPLKYTLPITGESLERTVLPAISPDGRHVVFVKAGTLWIRSLDQLDARQLSGTDGAQFPFWSPDSRQIAYLTASSVWRVGMEGSPPVRVTNYHFSKGGRTPGGVWLTDDTLVFAPSATGSGLLSVPARGGEFVDYYKRDPKTDVDFHRPSLLPDGRSILFVVDHGQRVVDTIAILTNGTRKDVLTLEGEIIDSPVYSPTGHILYHRETTSPGVWAVSFSLPRMEVTGTPFLVAAEGAYPSIARNGTLIYAERSVSGLEALVWVDVKTANVTPAFMTQFGTLSHPRLSPNGDKVAAVVQSPGEGEIVIVADLRRQTHVRIDNRANSRSRPSWRDNSTVVYGRIERTESGMAIVMRADDGSSSERIVGDGVFPSVTGSRLVFARLTANGGGNLYHALLSSVNAPTVSETLQQLPEQEAEPTLSPDGRLLAYTSGDVGQSQIILRTFPESKGRWQVSSAGGSYPIWSPRGDALYYRDVPGQVMRVEVRTAPTVTLGTPQVVPRPSSLVARLGFDVSKDGTRLLMVQEVKTDEQRGAAVAVVQNWFASFR